jgi:hypothetical protein
VLALVEVALIVEDGEAGLNFVAALVLLDLDFVLAADAVGGCFNCLWGVGRWA